MHKAKSAVLHMLFPMCKLPELAAAVEIPHLELPAVAARQQAPLLGVQCHRRQAPIAMAALEVALALPCVDVPHADCATLIATDDLQQGRAQSRATVLLFCKTLVSLQRQCCKVCKSIDYTAGTEHNNGDALPWADVARTDLSKELQGSRCS